MRCVFLILLVTLCFSVKATNYYVSANGNDANNGTSPTTAWRTIAKVNSQTFLPGDAILFRRGDMWREQLNLNSSGSAGNPITYGAFGSGAKPIFNGADLITGWTNVGSSVWSVNNPNVVTTRAMVIVGGIICSEVSTRAAVNSPSKYFIDQAVSPRKIYVYSAVDPASVSTEVSKREYGIVATDGRRIHHVNIVNLQAQYAGNGGLMFYGTEGQQFQGNCVVDSCVFYGNRLHGCAAYDGHANDVFKNSVSNYNGNGFYTWLSESLSVQNCSTAHNIAYLVAPNMTDGHAYGAYRANNWLVESCVSDDDNDAIHTDAGGVVANAIIRYNKVYNSRSGSPSTPGMGVGSLAAGGLIQIYYNLIVNCASNGFESYTKQNGQVRFYNNTVYLKAGTGTDGLLFLKYGDNFIVKNNLFIREYVANKYTVAIYNPAILTSDYNLFYNGGQPSRYYYNGGSYNTLSGWTTATGQDAHSLTADPLINSDYSLKSGSPCIDKGVSVGLTRDILGNPIVGTPDIGAFEQTTGAPAPNQAPKVNAGADQSIQLPTNSVTLSGTATDADGSISSSAWTIVSGPTTYTLATPNASQTKLSGLVQGDYVFRLTVTDNKGATAFDDVKITVSAAAVANVAPVVNAGSDKTIVAGSTLNLAGTATDADGSVSSYAWSVVSGTAGVNFSSPGTATTNVTGLQQGTYTLRLTATDNKGATAYDDVIITVNASAPVPNVAPTVNAGTDQSIAAGITVSLKGTASDADGSIAKYLWTVVSGTAGVNFSSPGTATTNVSGLQQGTYTFRLTVTDNSGATAYDDIKVTVNAAAPAANIAPTVNAGVDQTIAAGSTLSLKGTASDADGSIIAYSWTVTSGAAGVNFSSSATAATNVTGLTQGTYTFRLMVKDNIGAVAYDDVNVTVNGSTPAPAANAAPTVNAGADQTIAAGNTLSLRGTAADSDGSIIAYSWSVVSGAGANFSSSATAATNVTGLTQGTYIFRLTVKDNVGAVAYDDVKVTVNGSAPATNLAPTVNVGSDQTISLGSTLSLKGTAADTDGSIIAYSWTTTSGAAGVNFSSSATASTNVTGLSAGKYIFRLTVKDNLGAVAYDEIQVTVNAVLVAAAPYTNMGPTANADDTLTITLPVQNLALDGQSSYDADGNIVAYNWTFVDGPSIPRILTPQQSKTFVADLQEGQYDFKLTVTDDKGAKAEAKVVVVVKQNSNKRETIDFKLYPNPAASNVTLTVATEKKGRTSVIIYDSKGVLVSAMEFMKDGNNLSQVVNIAGLSQGNYFVIVKIDNAVSSVKKLVKM